MKSDSARPGYFLSMLVVLSAVLALGAPGSAQSGELTMTDLATWLDAYGEAWESRDPHQAAKLFSEDSTYQVTPYEEPHAGPDGVRDYWASVTEGQRNVQFEHQPLSVSGNTGIAHWSAHFDVVSGGTKIELNGIFVLEFDDNGKCRRLREWWHLKSQDVEDED